jgi:hypothetical protein
MNRFIFILGLIILVFLASLSLAGIPKMINYQGMLTKSDGKTPVDDGNYNLTFKIYGSLAGTDSLWREYHPNVPVTNGLFNIILGSITTLNLAFNTDYWLGIRVGSDPELSPRIRLTSVGYAYRAVNADTASVALTAPNGGGWTDAGSKVYLTTSSDSVGIGTNTPKNKLDVEGGVVIGDAYSGSYTAPTNGLLVLGNIGVGTPNPKAKLDVVGMVRVKSVTWPDSGRGMELGYNSGLHKGYIQVYDRDSTKWGNLYLGDGNVGIGTGYPGEKLHVVGTVKCSVLKLTGGSDIAEPFDIKKTDMVKTGMVLVIDPDNPGKLKLSDKAYDRCVAGIISGAGGIEPGVLMGKSNSVADGEYPVAMTGRVYGWADASNGPIQPGDLLTTSDTPGHAMKVTDYTKAQGAVIGKAMSSLQKGRGLVLVLVSLQ